MTSRVQTQFIITHGDPQEVIQSKQIVQPEEIHFMKLENTLIIFLSEKYDNIVKFDIFNGCMS